MVMQSGDVPAGGEDSKSAKPLPWKYILIAAVLAASILGIFFAATTGIFSSDPIPAASTNTISGASQPATNPGLVLTDNEDDNRITKAARIPSPNEIAQDRFIDISNPPKFVKANAYDLAITDIKISKSSNTIKASYINTNPEKSIAIRPVLINFFNENKNNIFREQWHCSYSCDGTNQVNFKYGNGYAHCQWPEDFCYIWTGHESGKKVWRKYWEEKLGKKQQPQKVGSTEYKEIIPMIKPGEKYSFAVSCEMPDNTRYINI